MNRRSFIFSTAAVTTAALSGCGGGGNSSSLNSTDDDGQAVSNPPTDSPNEALRTPIGSFQHGVASGDPMHDRVIVWTRITPDDPTSETIPVDLIFSKTPEFDNPFVIQTSANAERDFCVKVDVTQLTSNTWYYFAFNCGDATSPIGRTRTFPAEGERTRRARFATVSCSNLPYGHFSVYTALAKVPERDLDFVLHLGDYLYEYEPGNYDDPASVPNRVHEPANEIVSLSDYRTRHGQYKRDPDLQAVHQQYPMICIWDDHEFTNDAFKDGAENHTPATEGDWETRKNRAMRAYFEWMPVREFANDEGRIWRQFQYGDLIDLWMLDTRIEGRDAQASLPFGPERTDESRELISEAQMQWLTSGLANSQARWKMIGQQVMFGQLNIAELPQPDAIAELVPYGTTQQGVNMDQWDGYTSSRNKILDAIEQNEVSNVVIFTGDIHTSWANEIYRNPATLLGDLFDSQSALAVEFVCPAVSSPGFPDGLAEAVAPLLSVTNPHVKYSELKKRGFILMDVDRFGTQAEYHYVTSISDESRKGELESTRKLVKVFATETGRPYRLEQDFLSATRPRTTQTAFLAPPATEAQRRALGEALKMSYSMELYA
ncbi:alkaline phosphatase D family protein [Marinobacter adhaerens]|uniref:Twin-arginine translocation pathway signal n=2 Tax=Marinobacter adhaerens TaxID=1033846 RepID=E4PS76_MARAH|nr:alkaline phosphatase D family protein [Marinobacter adhaerens]ADQ00111.1 twin-arginine translocation pathway signal [Marinobacter adhaerens HP15]